MGKNTAIEWTDHTWNCWQGCTPISAGCKFCYMFRDKKRYGQDPTIVVRSKDKTFNSPLDPTWKSGDRVFVCSWSDFFHKDADLWRDEAWEIIRQRPDLIFMILTKREENIIDRLPSDWGGGWPNVWLGVTAENQEMANKRIPILLEIPVAVRFVSCEPLLSEVRFNHHWLGACDAEDHEAHSFLDWVITGCESGPKRRKAEIEWFRNLRDQCQQAGVPYFLKQMDINGKLTKTPMLDGRVWNELPIFVEKEER